MVATYIYSTVRGYGYDFHRCKRNVHEETGLLPGSFWTRPLKSVERNRPPHSFPRRRTAGAWKLRPQQSAPNRLPDGPQARNKPPASQTTPQTDPVHRPTAIVNPLLRKLARPGVQTGRASFTQLNPVARPPSGSISDRRSMALDPSLQPVAIPNRLPRKTGSPAPKRRHRLARYPLLAITLEPARNFIHQRSMAARSEAG
jgi:hypothetical protein